MRIRGSSFLLLRGVSLVFVLLAALLLVFQMIQYSVSRSNYPPDMTIGGVPVGGLDPQAAAQRLFQVFATPVEIHYGSAIIDLEPGLVGFQLNTESMLAAADLQRTGASFWGGFWDYLWNRRSPASQIPLVASYSEDRLRLYLQNEISSRYDQSPIPAQPIPGTANFTPGLPGQTLDMESAVALIENTLKSPDHRVVNLTSQRTAAGRPSLGTLQILLKQIIDQSNFAGIVNLYFLDLQTADEMHFAYQSGQDLSVTPTDIAFSANSTMKIPIMVSVFRHFSSKIDAKLDTELNETFVRSDNNAADLLMHSLDDLHGPLIVTDTMKKLGLGNTFIAMYFAANSIPLDHPRTDANTRSDITTNPDDFNQTTPADMTMLLEDIYQCSQTGGGSLVAVFPAQIDQAACKQMINYMQKAELGSLIQAGVPEGTIVAHKYGWDNNVSSVGDAAIIYTPGGNYILTIYAYDSGEYIWNIISPVYAELSRAVYNFFNLPSQ